MSSDWWRSKKNSHSQALDISSMFTVIKIISFNENHLMMCCSVDAHVLASTCTLTTVVKVHLHFTGYVGKQMCIWLIQYVRTPQANIWSENFPKWMYPYYAQTHHFERTLSELYAEAVDHWMMNTVIAYGNCRSQVLHTETVDSLMKWTIAIRAYPKWVKVVLSAHLLAG